MPRVLALDLGTKTGFAYSDNDGTHLVSGVWIFTPRKFEGGGMRYLRFIQQLISVRPDIIFFEAVRRHLGVDAAHIYGGFYSHLQAYCESHSIPHEGVDVKVIKKSATGTGNASKELVIEKMSKLWKREMIDDNHADALAVLDWAFKNRAEAIELATPKSNPISGLITSIEQCLAGGSHKDIFERTKR